MTNRSSRALELYEKVQKTFFEFHYYYSRSFDEFSERIKTFVTTTFYRDEPISPDDIEGFLAQVDNQALYSSLKTKELLDLALEIESFKNSEKPK